MPIFWVLVPRIGRPGDRDNKARLIETARSAGFSGVIDLTGAFDGLDPTALAVDRDDFHPNALGHSRLARRLDLALESLPEVARIWDGTAGSRIAGRLTPVEESSPGLSDEQVKATSFAPSRGALKK